MSPPPPSKSAASTAAPGYNTRSATEHMRFLSEPHSLRLLHAALEGGAGALGFLHF
nr:hypothetical protein [uncultured Albidiferax sp.]